MSAKRLTRTELIRALHHALNTPLVSITNLTEMLLLGVEGALNPVVRQDITDIADDAQNLRDVIAHVLQLVEGGVTALQFQHFDLAETLLRASQTELRGIVTQTPHKSFSVWGDQKALIQVVQKLEAQVQCTQVADAISVRVSIADEQVHVLVGSERLQNEQCNNTHLDDASHIDLLFCYQVIEAHGGTLWLAEELDQPTQFIISLPLTNTS